jgi:hypothetical protein
MRDELMSAQGELHFNLLGTVSIIFDSEREARGGLEMKQEESTNTAARILVPDTRRPYQE